MAAANWVDGVVGVVLEVFVVLVVARRFSRSQSLVIVVTMTVEGPAAAEVIVLSVIGTKPEQNADAFNAMRMALQFDTSSRASSWSRGRFLVATKEKRVKLTRLDKKCILKLLS